MPVINASVCVGRAGFNRDWVRAGVGVGLCGQLVCSLEGWPVVRWARRRLHDTPLAEAMELALNVLLIVLRPGV